MDEKIKEKELNAEELKEAAGGNDGMYSGSYGFVSGLASGYLAVRSSARPGSDNQIGGLLNGNEVTVLGQYQNGYTLIRAYCPKTSWTNETGWQTGWADARYICVR